MIDYRTFCHALACAAFPFLATACSCQQQADEEVMNRTEVAVRSIENEDTAFADGATIRIYGTGALAVDCVTLTYNGKDWRTDATYEWGTEGDSAHVVALSPAMTKYDAASLYDAQGNLQDLLYADVKVVARQPLAFTLHHRFSRIVVRLTDEQRRNVVRMDLSVPVSVSDVSPQEARLQLNDSQGMTTVRELDGSQDEVAFVVPSEWEGSVTLTLTQADGTRLSYDYEPKKFEVNEEYSASVIFD
jgi:hypothetical protein